jgi:predicted membrane channel-forming protein YqfA (hemolysin III family)
MDFQKISLAQRLRIAGILIVLGLMVELLTLAWNDPIAFIVFLGAGGLLIFVGMVVYLWSLVSQEQQTSVISNVSTSENRRATSAQ